MANRTFEEAVRECQNIVCNDSNVLWLREQLDSVVEHARNRSPEEKRRNITESEMAVVKLLEDAFQNSNVSPRYYAEFVRLLYDGYQMPAERLIRKQELLHNRRPRAFSGAPISER
jgi:hypothetical protein